MGLANNSTMKRESRNCNNFPDSLSPLPSVVTSEHTAAKMEFAKSQRFRRLTLSSLPSLQLGKSSTAKRGYANSQRVPRLPLSPCPLSLDCLCPPGHPPRLPLFLALSPLPSPLHSAQHRAFSATALASTHIFVFVQLSGSHSC